MEESGEILMAGLRGGGLNDNGGGEEWVDLRDLGGKHIGSGNR